MSKGDKILGTVCGFIQLGCIAGLTAIGLKRNNDCYKAECKLIDVQHELTMEKLNGLTKDLYIECLKGDIARLKAKEVKEEETQ